jgi:hypothetical protein
MFVSDRSQEFVEYRGQRGRCSGRSSVVGVCVSVILAWRANWPAYFVVHEDVEESYVCIIELIRSAIKTLYH